MDVTENVLLPILLAAILVNAAILAGMIIWGRLGHDKRVAATSVRGAGMDQPLLSSSYVDRSAAWTSDDQPTADEGSGEPHAMTDDQPELVLVPVMAGRDLTDPPLSSSDEAPPAAPAPGPAASAGPAMDGTEAGVDALTGLADAAAFARLVADEDSRLQRYRRPATVVVFELDGLDRLIDRLGPAAGDRVVPAVADTIRRLARSADHVARLAPGRFGVLMPETDEVAAINYVERVRRACELWLESGAMAMTLAIGWAGTTGEPALPDAQRIATDRMYAELRRLQRRADPNTPAPVARVDPTPVPTPVAPEAPAAAPIRLRTETEDDIPS
jgi:diguanylate cyclase (GGDEF)-like protein